MTEMRVGNRTIEVSNRDKVFFPDRGLTKGDLVDYYSRVAERMIPFLRNRPLTMHRLPDGIDDGGFIQQSAPEYFPRWIERATVEKEDGEITHALCNSRAALVYLANQGVLTPHVWLSRTDRPHHPDRLIFDLDPPDSGSENGFGAVCRAARAVHSLLEEFGLPAFVMTTGSRGLHVITPLSRGEHFDTVRSFARSAADEIARRNPDELTTEQRKIKRKGRVFLDTFRNAYGQTAVPPYAVRARPGAPVATPLDWEELGHSDLHPQRYTIQNLFRRLGQKEDPWAGLNRHAHSLKEPRKRLERMQEKQPS